MHAAAAECYLVPEAAHEQDSNALFFQILCGLHGDRYRERMTEDVSEELAEQNPKKVKASVRALFPEKLPEYESQWRKKVRQFQIPIFGENTDATWQLRFDDIIANALTLGPLREMEATLTKAQREKLQPYLHGKVRPEHLESLIAYYEANKPEDSDWAVLPVAVFNNYFGSTVFSKQVLKAVTGTVIERSDMSYGSGRYRVREEFL